MENPYAIGFVLVVLVWMFIAMFRLERFLSRTDRFDHHGPLYLVRMYCWQFEEFVDPSENGFSLARSIVLPLIDKHIFSEKDRPVSAQAALSVFWYYLFSPLIMLEVALSEIEQEMNATTTINKTIGG